MTSAALPSMSEPIARGRRRGGAAVGHLQWSQLRSEFDPLRIMMFALILMNISRIHLAIPVLKAIHPAQILAVLTAGYAYINSRSLTRVNIMASWPMRRVAMLAVVAFASVAFGISIGKSASFIINNYSKTLLMCFLIPLTVRNVKDLYTYAWAVALSCGILAYYSIFVFKITASAFSLTGRVDKMYGYDANDVCVVALVGLGTVLLLLQVCRGWRKWLLFLITIGIAATIARSGSRGGFLGVAAFGFAALFLINTVAASKRLMLLGAVVLGMVMFAPPGYMKQMATLLSLNEDYNTITPNGRKALALRGLNYLGHYPIFGLGIDNFAMAECDYNLSRLKPGANGTRCGAPHNSYVEAASETGLVGFFIWASLVFGGISAMLKLRRRLPRPWSRGSPSERFLYNATTYFALSLVGFAVTAAFVSFAWVEILYLEVAFLSGLYISITVYNASPAAGDTGAAAAPAGRMPGWRVKQSAHRRLAPVRSVPRLAAPR